MRTLISVVAVLLVSIACGEGTPQNDPRLQACLSQVAESEARLQALSDRLSGVEATAGRLATLTSSQEAAIKDALASLEGAAAEVAERQAAVSKREREVSQVVEGLRRTSFADGTWEVGRDILPGKYRTQNPNGGCYWEKNSGQDGLRAVIANDIASGPTTVVISSSVPFFKSKDCGTWYKID